MCYMPFSLILRGHLRLFFSKLITYSFLERKWLYDTLKSFFDISLYNLSEIIIFAVVLDDYFIGLLFFG